MKIFKKNITNYVEYSAYPKKINLLKIYYDIVKNLIKGSYLGWVFAQRDIFAKYRNSLLGIFSALLSPIYNSIVYIFLQYSNILNFGHTEIPYPLYIITGNFIWQIFTDSFNMAQNIIDSGTSISARVPFPREALIIAGLLKLFFEMALKFLPVIIIFLFFRVIPGSTIVWFPVFLLILIFSGLGLGLLSIPLTTFFKDFQNISPIVFNILFWLTPIVYLPPAGSLIKKISGFNPLTPLIITVRDSLLGTNLLMLNSFYLIGFIFLVCFVIGLLIFKISTPYIYERI